MEVAIAAALRPFVALILIGLIAWPLSMLIKRYMPEGRLKRILFFSWKV